MSELVQAKNITKECLDYLKELCGKSTQVVGWYAHSQHDGYHPGKASVRGPFGRWFMVDGATKGQQGYEYVADLYDDAKFAAVAMNYLPALLELLDEKDKEIKKLKSLL